MWWPWGHGGQGERQGQVAPPQQAPVAAVSSTTSSSDSPATRHNSNQTSAPPADLKRPPLLGLGAACFFLAFAGATIYGFRAAKKAELKEAADLANKTFAQGANSSSSSLASAPSALTRGPTAAAGQSHANARATTTSTTMDWGSPAGSSAPSVLSKSAAGGRSTTPSRFAVPLPKMQDGKPVFEESPALTAIKAFGIATALVGVVSVASIEVGRRVWQIEDMYDLTDRLHAKAPKAFRVAEDIGEYFRTRLGGIFPSSEEDRQDPWAEDERAQSSSSSSRSSWLPFSLNSTSASTPAPQLKPVEEAFDEIEKAETMRERMHLLDAQLRAERAAEDQYRQELRLRRQRQEGGGVAAS